MNSYSWKDRFLISLKEEFTIKDICILCGYSTLKAIDVRKNAIELKKREDPDYIPPNIRIDANAVFAVTGHDTDYYLKKMKEEKLALEK